MVGKRLAIPMLNAAIVLMEAADQPRNTAMTDAEIDKMREGERSYNF